MNFCFRVILVYRFPAALIAFAGFFTACRCAPQIQSHSLDSKVDTVSLEMTVSESDSERDTDALVSKCAGDISAEDTEDARDQEQTEQKQTASLSLFRILCMASGTIFGSIPAVVFFLNLFFINIGTNVVEGLVRAILANKKQNILSCKPCQVFMFFKNDLGASSSVLGEQSQSTSYCVSSKFNLCLPGWSVVVTVIFEIPLMYWAPEVPLFKTCSQNHRQCINLTLLQLLKRFKTGTLIVVAELSYSIRTLVYTFIGSNTWILLLIEPCAVN
jgi:hypothetical protein